MVPSHVELERPDRGLSVRLVLRHQVPTAIFDVRAPGTEGNRTQGVYRLVPVPYGQGYSPPSGEVKNLNSLGQKFPRPLL